MAIFQYGISWDPCEPPPDGYTDEEIIPYMNGNNGPPGVHVKTRRVDPPFGNNHVVLPISTFRDIPVPAPTVPTLEATTQPEPKNILPPLSVAVDGTILHDMARVSVVQMFESPTTGAVTQARYTFPLPDNCTVTAFSCRFGTESVLKGKVKPKEEAREKYDEAVRDHRSTGLLEQVTTEVFTASLGNIPANTRLKTEITYLASLKTDFSAEKTILRFLMPTAIGPRYGSQPETTAIPTSTPDTISLKFEIHDIEGATINCETHSVTIETHDQPEQASSLEDLLSGDDFPAANIVRVQLSDKEPFHQQDLVLSIAKSPTDHQTNCQAWAEKHSSLDNQMAMMIDVPRRSLPLPIHSSEHGEVVFLADRSGSMRRKIPALKSSLQFFLKGIPVGWSFNLWSFGSSYEYLWEDSRQYSPESLEEALTYVEHELEANLGGTEILRATEALVESRTRTGPCEIIILTDGQVWRLEEMLQYVKKARNLSQGALRFFALGIGHRVSAALVDGIARYGGGYSDIVQGDASEGWEDRVVKMLDAALSSRMDSTISLDLGDDFQIQHQTPQDLRIINTPFQSSKLFVLFTGNGTPSKPSKVTLNIKSNKPTEKSASVSIPVTWDRFGEDMVHGLAAHACLDEMAMRQVSDKRVARSSKHWLDRDSGERGPSEAENLACRYSLLSKWTSLFLEHEKPKDDLQDFVDHRNQEFEQVQGPSALLAARQPLRASISSPLPLVARQRYRVNRLTEPHLGMHGQLGFARRRSNIVGSTSSQLHASEPEDYQGFQQHVTLDSLSRQQYYSTVKSYGLQVHEYSHGRKLAKPRDHKPTVPRSAFEEPAPQAQVSARPASHAQKAFEAPVPVDQPYSYDASYGNTPPSFTNTSTSVSHDTLATMDTSKDPRGAIIEILQKQRYDGSMDDKVIGILGKGADEAVKTFCALISDQCTEMDKVIPRDVAIAMLVIAVLHEDYADMANLWKLIVNKAKAYVEREVGGLLQYDWMKDEAARFLRGSREREPTENSGDMEKLECENDRLGDVQEEDEFPSQPEWTELDTAPF